MSPKELKQISFSVSLTEKKVNTVQAKIQHLLPDIIFAELTPALGCPLADPTRRLSSLRGGNQRRRAGAAGGPAESRAAAPPGPGPARALTARSPGSAQNTSPSVCRPDQANSEWSGVWYRMKLNHGLIYGGVRDLTDSRRQFLPFF